MRVTLGSIAALALVAVVSAGCSQQASTAQAAAAPQGEPVTAVGCPDQATPACLTIKAKGKIYDITGAVDTSRGVAVSVSGTAAGETTACGLKLDGIQVEYNGIMCGAPTPAPAA
jgi:hypothetical protein